MVGEVGRVCFTASCIGCGATERAGFELGGRMTFAGSFAV